MRPPVAVTEQGQSIRDLYDFVFVIAVGVFVLVEGLIIIAVIRYRRRPTDTELPKQVHGNNVLEVVWTVIPTVIVAVMFVFSCTTLNTVDAVQGTTDVRIRAVAAQFQWSFQYLSADGTTVLLRAARPGDGRPGRQGGPPEPALERRHPRLLRAPVPVQAGRRAGRENIFEFTVDAADAGQTFRGQCAELCGTYHGAMLFTVKALSPADYDAWLAQQIAKAKATPAPSGSAGAGVPGAVTLELAAKDVAFDKSQPRGPGRQAVLDRLREQRRLRLAQRRDQGRAAARRSSRATSSWASSQDLRRPGPRGRHLHLLLLGPPDDDRHAHGQVRSPHGDDRPDASRHRSPLRACTTG